MNAAARMTSQSKFFSCKWMLEEKQRAPCELEPGQQCHCGSLPRRARPQPPPRSPAPASTTSCHITHSTSQIFTVSIRNLPNSQITTLIESIHRIPWQTFRH
ncbi:unnamed protein product [Arctia plantaginis]|uniref:Uncharacterized protein n=1 Tax=Arctia plantaginis TaxID=874455 RepID=A0A8S1AZ97_ARCPL|nr:unnamed protein product [Arctia plantaginis]